SDMTGRVSLQEGALDLSLSSARVAGVRLRKFILQSDDLYTNHPEIRIKGMAEGEREEMAAVLRQMDVGPHIGQRLSQAEVVGRGKLQAAGVLSGAPDEIAGAGMQGRSQVSEKRIDLGR